MSNIPLSVPSIKGNEWKYIKECLDTEWVSSAGTYVTLFEEKIANLFKIKVNFKISEHTNTYILASKFNKCNTIHVMLQRRHCTAFGVVVFLHLLMFLIILILLCLLLL